MDQLDQVGVNNKKQVVFYRMFTAVDWETFEAKCKEFRFDRFVALIEALADVVEGKREYEMLPATYKEAFASAYRDSFDAQVAMFPAMVQGSVPYYIGKYRDAVLAWKMPGAGGGGYLACVVSDASAFFTEHPDSICLTIRRGGM